MVCHLGLTGRLLLNDRRDEVTDRFELMTVCPRQHKRDIIAQTSRLRVLRCHTQRLSQELSPWLLVTSENVSRHQGFGAEVGLDRQETHDALPVRIEGGSRVPDHGPALVNGRK